MSDPVTNAEIEDVLTSIRRLVSENRKAVASVAPGFGAPAEEPPENTAPADESAESSALVLTPALRVSEEEAPAADDFLLDDQSSGMDAEDGEDPFADTGEEDPEQVVLHWEDAAPDTVDPDPFEEHDNDGEAAETGESPEADAEPEEAASGDEPDHLQTFAGRRDEAAAQDRAEADSDPALVEAEGADGDVYEDGEPDEGDISRVENACAEDMPPGEEAPFDFQQVLESRISQWRDGEPEAGLEDPDAPGDSDYAGTVEADPAWDIGPVELVDDSALDALEAELEEEFVEEVQAAVIPELADAVDEAAVVDEEILREMVADIVRQELQGALGERITRNVRKLVRREIHRALAAHDLN